MHFFLCRRATGNANGVKKSRPGLRASLTLGPYVSGVDDSGSPLWPSYRGVRIGDYAKVFRERRSGSLNEACARVRCSGFGVFT